VIQSPRSFDGFVEIRKRQSNPQSTLLICLGLRQCGLSCGLWCKWRGPIGYADPLSWSRSAMSKLKIAEELFKGAPSSAGSSSRRAARSD
jgi:hypothetical protein